MDRGRLLAYRSVRSALDVEALNDGERERLRDIAEALLLTRVTHADDAGRLRRPRRAQAAARDGVRRVALRTAPSRPPRPAG